jgi:D-sedoheptulose 7-phosphate isomerase
MDLAARVTAHFSASIDTQRQTLAFALAAIVQAGQCLADCLRRRGKVLICGNGGSAADAQHFSGELLGRLEGERRALAAIALTTDTSTLTAVANDYAFGEVFARQVQALGQAGDVLVAISTSGRSANIVKALQAAQRQGLTVIALTGRDGGTLAELLRAEDIEIRVPATRTMHIQEAHGLIIHCLCDLVDQLLLDEED